MRQYRGGAAVGQVNHVFTLDGEDLDRIEVISSGQSCSTSSSAERQLNEQSEAIELCQSNDNFAQRRESTKLPADDFMRASTPTNMVRRWSQNIARFSKDHKPIYERTIYRLPSRDVFQLDGLVPITITDSPGAVVEAEVDQLAAEVERYTCLMEDTARSKQNRLETLRALPQPLTTKRMLKHKLAHVIEQQLLEEPRRRTWGKRLWNICVAGLLHLWRLMRAICRSLEIWYHTLKAIESNYGRNVVSYFKFLRWLLVLNTVLAVCCLSFITLPQTLYDTFVSDVSSDGDEQNATISCRFVDFLTAEGCLKTSLMFYGSYSNVSFALMNPNHSYSLSHAYYMTMLMLYLCTFVVISTSMARSYRKSFLELFGSTGRLCGEKILCSWDYSIASRKAAELKHLSIYTELKKVVSDIDKAKEERSWLWRLWLFCSQLIANSLILALIAGLGFAVCIFLQYYGATVGDGNSSTWSAMRVAVIINSSLLLFQLLFSWIASIEDNYSPRRTLHVTLVRNFVLELVVVGILLYFLLTQDPTECWENSLGQEMYRFMLCDLALGLILTPLLNVLRVFVLNHFWSGFGHPAFDISQQSVGLVYNQTLLWIGLFFAPPLAALMALKMALTFYVKYMTLLHLCKSPRHVWHLAQSRTLYLVFTFLSLLGAIIALGYIMTQVPVSPTCGPFRDYNLMFQIFIDGVLRLREHRSTWRLLMLLIRPAAIGVALIIIAIMVYYMHAKAHSRCVMVKMLKEMIYQEIKDKEFLLATITNFTKNREWLHENDELDADAAAAADRYAESSASWRHTRYGTHRSSRTSGESEQTLRTSDESILRSRNV